MRKTLPATIHVWTPRAIAEYSGFTERHIRKRIKEAVKKNIVPPQSRPIAYNRDDAARLFEFILAVRKK